MTRRHVQEDVNFLSQFREP